MGYTVCMLSLLPQILFLAPLSAFVIRLALAFIFAYSAYTHVGRSDMTARAWAVVEAALAAALIAGAWTQAIVIVALLLTMVALIIPRMRIFPLSTILLTLVLCFSLLVTGAGAFAFDLPL